MTIPRRLHWVWLGGPMPEEYAGYIAGWRALHPDWETTVWTEENLPPLVNPGCYADARNPAQASDVLRYELLFRFGGIYLDCDVEPVKPLDPLLDHDLWAVTEGDIIGPAVMAAAPGHRIISAVLEALPAHFYSGAHNLDQAGPAFVTPILRAYGVTELPQESFFPYLYQEQPCPPTPNTYGIHRWAASWVPAAWR